LAGDSPYLFTTGIQNKIDRLLSESENVGDVRGLSVIDPAASVNYYRARWTQYVKQEGKFVARREQLYGSDLWCYLEASAGTIIKLVDFPLSVGKFRGCDEAWHMQACLDFLNGSPQKYRLRSGLSGSVIIDFFSPIPAWARRRWDIVGSPSIPHNCLFSYTFRAKELEEEIKFIRDILWMREL
jgi:hypothetical protein